MMTQGQDPLNSPVATAYPPTLCANCRGRLRGQARFCTRCGMPVGARLVPPRIAVQAPATGYGRPQAVRPAPPRRGRFRGLVVFTMLLLLAGIGAVAWFTSSGHLASLSSTGGPPQADEGADSPAPPESPAIVTSPAAPSPTQGLSSNVAISQVWAEPDAVDPTGAVGLRVHGLVDPHGAGGLVFAVHFRNQLGGPVMSEDARFSDAARQAATSCAVPSNRDPTDLSTFIPVLALQLSPGPQQLEVVSAVYDSSNQVVAVGPTALLNWNRGSFLITRAAIPTRANTFLDRILNVSFQVPANRAATGKVVVRFQDIRGLYLHGQGSRANAAGELTLSAPFQVVAQPSPYVVDALPIMIPAHLIPSRTTAKIAIFDDVTGQWLSTEVTAPLP